MIQHLDLDEIEELLELFGDVEVGLRRLGDSARMIMRFMCP
jgi:hypothetical protein